MQEIQVVRHSLSHIMAEAVNELFPNVKFAIGPSIENGFYYDFDIDQSILPEDLEKIENKMRELIKRDVPFEHTTMSKSEALKFFAEQPYKVELINGITDERVSIYKSGNFTDLCAGPHVENSRELRNCSFKLMSIAGAYWRGDSNNKMLQRIYAVAFANKEELKAYLFQIEEAKRRDHRKLGTELELFFIDETAPGMPYWLPNGLKLLNTLLAFWREEHEKRGYQEFSGPQLNARTLWETSGHWAHYKDNMYTTGDESNPLALKPMNCPNAMMVYKRKVRSYRELPLRFCDCDKLHRKEISGTLHGLSRVQAFTQDDSHNFVRTEQISDEINAILDIADRFYDIFGLKYQAVLSTRPADYMGDIKVWDKAEAELKSIMTKRFGADFVINEGDGAFYGPKIDLIMTDALNRKWQTGTIQLDFQLPRNFELTFTNEKGELETPVVVHRVIYGSFERFIGILIEHFAGDFPLWISPTQVGIVPVSENNFDYSQQIYTQIKAHGLRAEIDLSESGMGAKVNQYRKMKVPYVLILGDKEKENNTVSIKIRGGKQINDIPLDKFINVVESLNKEKTLQLAEDFK